MEELNRPSAPDQNFNLLEQIHENLNTLYPPDSHQNPSTSQNADQHGGHFKQEIAVSSDQIGQDPPAVVERERFNNHEIRRPFTIPQPCPGNVPVLAAFYTNIMRILIELADAARSLTRRNNVVQLELVGENLNRPITFTVTDNGNMILPAFENFVDD
ncbi:hypothetical protein CHARACLAT_033244 [Characodon lateralis]|uniref:Uncharacterized protein n=1 Tax=Characodon lateralis TaxID=208331 RepID=A0ABU7DCR1_9TELE|nr:hypothetical protein [Characodon lateralis]